MGRRRARGRELLVWHRDFRRLWMGHTLSQFGSQISVLAIPLAALVTLRASGLE